MLDSECFKGQWVGHFKYGPDYGPELEGEKVQFRLFINTCSNDEFEGKSIDLEGIGANYEVAEIRGFLKENFISFTKQYPFLYSIDEWGNTVGEKNQAHPPIHYEGHYDLRTKTISGNWEMAVDIEPIGEGWLEQVSSGTWEAVKDEFTL